MPDQSTRKYTPRQPLVHRFCETCGTPFESPAWRIASGGGRFCSRACVVQPQRATRPVTERFWEKVNKGDGENACWLWTARTSHGYGSMSGGDRYSGHLLAHRLSYELVSGPIPDGLHVLHTCDNRACVRNDDEGFYELNGILHPRHGHLWLGTNADNVADMMAKGRYRQHGYHRGESHHNAKLTEDAVREIRRLREEEYVSLSELARRYGVSLRLIQFIIRREIWNHVL